MKKSEITIGKTYYAKASGKITQVQITRVNPYGRWDAINKFTTRPVHIRGSARLRSEVKSGMPHEAPIDDPHEEAKKAIHRLNTALNQTFFGKERS